ncbi:MAG: DUF4268 domain-containing protein [Bacteroidetes bacterium]|nr:DUF4268 domain-containing protein [Bacteroidota bacterium]
MYTRQEISKQKQIFWTAFGRYMKPILSADGEEISWINYKTGNRHISFKMDVDSRRAVVSIVIDHPDAVLREIYYERWLQLKGIFYEALGEGDWIWRPNDSDEHGRAISRIYKELGGVNIFRNEDWPAIISFLKPRIIGLDAFWGMVRYQFSTL